MQELKVHSSGDSIEPMVHEDEVRKIFSRRLALACRKAGLETHGQQIRIAKAMGVTPKAVSKWFNAEAIPRRGKMAELAAFLHVSASYLIGETEDEGIQTALLHVDSDVEYAGKVKTGYVPVVGEAVLGVDGSVDMIEFRAGWLQMYSGDRDAYGLKVKGDSMYPRIHSGEFVLIEPNTHVHSGDEVFVRTTDGHNMIKVMTKTRDGNYQFSSINNEHKPITLDVDQVDKMHYVSAIVKATRYLDHDDVPRIDGGGI